MVKDNTPLSPEKQLLKLIEEPHGAALKGAVVRGKGVTLFSLGALQGRWIFLRQNLTAFFASWGGPLDIKKINVLLTMIAVLTGAAFAASSFALAGKFSVLPSFSFKMENAAQAEALKQVTQIKSLSTYMEKIQARDIFKIGKKAPVEESGGQQEANKKAQQENVLSKYKLVGISWSDNPDAMIEEIAAKKTFFLKRGQVMADGVKIQAIFKDKVVLNYSGAEIELR
jgi:hypothetical protein